MQSASNSRSAPPTEPERWGCLIPWASSMHGQGRIDLWKAKTEYVVGREQSSCDIRLPLGNAISKRHCIIRWDGDETQASMVLVEDLSSNGTFINNEPVRSGNNPEKRLRDGSEISFGLANRTRPYDHRFVFRQIQVGQNGVYAGVDGRYYDLLSILGQGSFGTVALAMDRVSRRQFAVKTIRTRETCVEASGQRSAYGERVEREVEILRRLGHAHICRLVHSFFEEKRLDLVLEYVPCGNLAEYMKKNGAIAESQAQIITSQICSALYYVHNQGVIHRDIKPANVLIANRTPMFVKVADFGLAKAIQLGPNGTPQLQLQTQCGTPAYAAPESGTGFYDYKVDSWSLGVMVYQMLTTSLPFPVTMGRCVGRKQAVVKYTALTSVSDQGKHFIGQLLQYYAAARMSSREAIAHAWIQEAESEDILGSEMAGAVTVGTSPPRLQGLDSSGVRLWHDSSPRGSADTVIQFSRSSRGRVAQT